MGDGIAVTWKRFRIAVLLLILGFVALDMVLEQGRLTQWERPLRVVIYPLSGDDSEVARRAAADAKVAAFAAIEKYFEREAERHRLPNRDLLWIQVAPPIAHRPPPIPYGGNILAVMWWSLKQRWWMWRNDTYQGIRPELRVLALYYDPKSNPTVPHSTGLAKGRIAITHVYAGQTKSNNVVIAHELLHTLGASDKYDLNSGLPIFPQGYIEPQRQPLFPQPAAELMGGAIPQSKERAEYPRSLGQTRIGPLTATEIGWNE